MVFSDTLLEINCKAWEKCSILWTRLFPPLTVRPLTNKTYRTGAVLLLPRTFLSRLAILDKSENRNYEEVATRPRISKGTSPLSTATNDNGAWLNAVAHIIALRKMMRRSSMSLPLGVAV